MTTHDAQQPTGTEGGWRYRVAGLQLESTAPLPALAAFLCGASRPPWTAGATLAPTRCTYRGRAGIGGSERPIAAFAGSDGYRLEIGDLPPITIDARRAVIRVDGELDSVSAALTETLLGPALTLALAARGVFCLHASALRREHHAVLFAGASGIGKSTIAAAGAAAGWIRVSDDATPVVPRDGHIAVEPHFPQLKLRPEEQYPGNALRPLELAALYMVESSPATIDRPRIEPLSGAGALAAIASQTVAARLFDPALLEAHLELCRQVAAAVPVRRLTIPRRLPAIADALTLVAAELELDAEHGR